MRLTNIIDRVNEFSAHDVTDDKSEVFGALARLVNGTEQQTRGPFPGFQTKLQQIRSGALKLLELERVYGASIFILAKSFVLEKY